MTYYIGGSKQAIFDKVCNHLAQQKKQALDPDDETSCMYRSKDGTTCAIGCLIPDNVYKPDMEGYTATGLFQDNSLRSNIGIFFFQSLQNAHDISTTLIVLKAKLNKIAEEWKLNAAAVNLITEWNNTQ